MAQGEFTREELRATRQALDEIFLAVPKAKRLKFLGHLNDIFLFLGAVERHMISLDEAKETGR